MGRARMRRWEMMSGSPQPIEEIDLGAFKCKSNDFYSEIQSLKYTKLSNSKITRRFCRLTGCTMRLLCHDVMVDVSLWRQEWFLYMIVPFSFSLFMWFHTFPHVSPFLFSSIHSPFLFPYSLSKVWHHSSVAVCGAAYVECVWKSRGLGALQSLFSNCHNSGQIRLAVPNPQPVWAAPDSPRHCHSTSFFAV